MRTFLYRAKAGPEEVVEGKITAASREEAVAMLSRKGYVATSLEESCDKGQAAPHTGDNVKRIGGIRQKDLISFTRQLAVLTKAGVPLVRGLNILSGQAGAGSFKQAITEISERIRNGETLSSGLSGYPRVFSAFYRAMVAAGEESGTIDGALFRLADYYQKQARLRSRVRSAVAYPVFILVVGILTVIFVFTNVMPRIIPVLLSLDTSLPMPTRILMGLNSFFRDNWAWLALALAIFTLMFRKAMRNKAFNAHVSSIKLNLPVFGELISKSELSRFTRAMGICLMSGIPIMSATSIASSIIGERSLKSRLEDGVKSLEKGQSLTETFAASGVFPGFALNLINVGEESGDLAGSLSDISDAFETDCGDAVEIVLSLLEPVMVLAIGLIVGFIVVAVLLPIFEMNLLQM